MRPSRPARVKPSFQLMVALLASASPAVAAVPETARDPGITSTVGGFLIVFAVVIVFVGVGRFGRRRRDKGALDAIDDFIEGSDGNHDDGADSAGDGGGDSGGDGSGGD